MLQEDRPVSKKSSAGKIVAVIAAAVLLIGCVVGTSFFFLKNKRDMEQEQEEQRAAQEAAQQEQEEEKMKAKQAQTEAEQAKAEAEKAKDEAEKAKAEAEKAQAQAQEAQAQAQAEKAKAENAQAQAHANAAQAQAQERAEMEQLKLNLASDTFYSYIYNFNDAVNHNDFSLVEPLLLNGSDIYNEQKKVVPYFAEQGITENVVSVSIKNMWLEGDSTAAVVSDEVIGVTYGDGSYREVSQSYTYYMQLQLSGGDWWWEIYKMVEA